MSQWNYQFRPLTLNELMDELEAPDVIPVPPRNVIIFPPEDEIVTDEDSGEEDNVLIHNLPGSQLRAEAEYELSSHEESDGFESEDDLPLSTFRSQNKSRIKKKVLYKFEKSDIRDDFLPIWPQEVSNNAGDSTLDPVELFSSFFDDDVINLLVTETNNYANAKNLKGDVNREEMQTFIGVLLLSGYVCLPRRKLYWQSSADTNNILVSKAISRDRFSFIMSNIHCRNNNDLDKNDKFSKVRPIFDLLNMNFRKFAPVEQFHSIDESMVPYFGRHGCKQFIRGKPIRWGYKFWMGTTRLGYILWFDPYQGKSSTISAEYKDLGLGASIVLQYSDVLSGLQDQVLPYHLFFDNFFTSLALINELTLRKMKATGTIRDNRMNKCPLIDKKNMKKKDRGYIDYMSSQEDNIILCKWNDNNIVAVASNASPVHPIRTVQRFSHKEKKKIGVNQPNTIKTYNENMGGVDRADQNMSLYRISIRGKKWYFPLIAQCIDMAIQNSWQLHRLHGGKLDQLAFRRSVTTSLLETYKKTSSNSSRFSANLHEHSRYDRRDHLVSFSDTQRKCRLCKKKVQSFCTKCDVALHVKECFYSYHTKN